MATAANLPSLEALEAMSPDELDEALGLKPKDDIPPAARRAMKRVGLVDEESDVAFGVADELAAQGDVVLSP